MAPDPEGSREPFIVGVPARTVNSEVAESAVQLALSR